MAEHLPGTTGERITDLRENAGLTIEELAAKIGVNATTLGRMEKGQTQKIGNDILTALAREFGVSADFLLGLTNIPDRKNYDIGELGLSAQAARNLYTQKVNPMVVTCMLEHPKFAVLTAMIAQYFDDTLAAGIAVQNQIFASMSELLMGEGLREAAQTVSMVKTPPHQMELSKIQSTFMAMLKDMKRNMESHLEAKQAATKELIVQMMAELTKGQEMPLTEITAEQMVDAIIHTVDGSDIAPDKLAEFRAGTISLFSNLPREAYNRNE